MFNIDDVRRTCPAAMNLSEWQTRIELAACYRVFDSRGWTEEIFNHITVRVPESDQHYLINPFGLNYGELTAHNLVKVDANGDGVSDTSDLVNRAGFIIHSAIHRAREDAHCIIHTHHTAGVAVASKENGLAMDNFYAALLYGKLAYHEFEGVTVHDGEKERLVASLGEKTLLILRNHGLLVAERDLPGAFYWMCMLQRACEVQVLCAAMAGPTLALSIEACEVSSRGLHKTDPGNALYSKVFAAAVRRAGITLDALVAR
jgi:ribulose-5-phosphate 4-epimerase/fuculose-1-phosphate aldolase